MQLRRCRFLGLWSFTLLTVFFTAGTTAQDATPNTSSSAKSIEWTRFDVDLELRIDGSLHVTERQTVAFHGGPFTFGYADLPLRNIEGIENVQVSEEANGVRVRSYVQVASNANTTTPYTFRVQTDEAFVNVDWWFEPTTDAERTFALEYDARGALRIVIEDGTRYGEIWWIAIDSEVMTSAPVRSATVTLVLPAAADPSRVLLSPEGYVSSTSGDWSVWRWMRTDLVTGDRFTIRLRFPAIILPEPPGTPSADHRVEAS